MATVPVGVPVVEGLTAAVKVGLMPYWTVDADSTSDVAVPAGLTVRAFVSEPADAWKLASPEYAAVRS